MPARKPEECDTILVDAINKGDLEAAIALYEPNARFVQESGEVVTGHPAIREEMKGFLALKPKFSIKVTGVQSADGNIALTQAKWSVSGTDARWRARDLQDFSTGTALSRRGNRAHPVSTR